MKAILKRIVRPLMSRKIRVALTNIAVTYATEFGLELETDGLLTVISMIVSLIAVILGIAIEDAGAKSSNSMIVHKGGIVCGGDVVQTPGNGAEAQTKCEFRTGGG